MNKKNAKRIRYGIRFGRDLAYHVIHLGLEQELAMKILTYQPTNIEARAARQTFARLILASRSGD